MIEDFEFKFEQTGLKKFEMIAFMGPVFLVHHIDELQDPYCLSNLRVFAQAMGGAFEKRPTGKLYKKHWEPFAPTWIAHESEKHYTWHLHPGDMEDNMSELLIKTGLPYQTRPETKMRLKINQPLLSFAIQLGLGLTPSSEDHTDTA